MEQILVIDDDRNLREVITELLELHGYDVITAHNGVDGLRKAIEEEPELIVCDVQMPGMTGFEVLEALQERTENAIPPLFLFLSARVAVEDLRTGMQHGAQDYLTKPFSSKELLEVVAMRLEQRKKLKQALAKRVSDKLHDEVQPMMLAARIGLNRVKKRVPLEAPESSALHDSIEYLNNALHLSREVAHQVRKQRPKLTTKQWLQKLKKRVALCEGMSIHISNEFQTNSLTAKEEKHLRCIVEELTTNALKYAGPAKIQLALQQQVRGKRAIRFSDNGNGFDANTIKIGLGFQNLKQHAEALNAALQMQSAPGKGTEILLVF